MLVFYHRTTIFALFVQTFFAAIFLARNGERWEWAGGGKEPMEEETRCEINKYCSFNKRNDRATLQPFVCVCVFVCRWERMRFTSGVHVVFVLCACADKYLLISDSWVIPKWVNTICGDPVTEQNNRTANAHQATEPLNECLHQPEKSRKKYSAISKIQNPSDFHVDLLTFWWYLSSLLGPCGVVCPTNRNPPARWIYIAPLIGMSVLPPHPSFGLSRLFFPCTSGRGSCPFLYFYLPEHIAHWGCGSIIA